MSEDNYTFYNADGTNVSKKFVESIYNVGKVYETEEYKHFFISSIANVKLKFIIPNEGYTIADVFTKENLNIINNIKNYDGIDNTNKIKYETRVIFPEFIASPNNSINEILKEDFNINEVFNYYNNPLNIIDDNIACSDIKHVTNLNVDRMGIEGAAVSLEQVATSTEPMTTIYNDFIIDKAFGYIITDYYNNILFSGVINKI